MPGATEGQRAGLGPESNEIPPALGGQPEADLSVNGAINMGEVTTPATTPTPSEPAASEAMPPSSSEAKPTNPLSALLEKCKAIIAGRKRKKLEKILEFARKNGNIKNDEVQKLILVSDKTATRYLDQLAGEGKLIRTGPAKHEFYRPV